MSAYEAYVTVNRRRGRVPVNTSAGIAHACKLAVDAAVGNDKPRKLTLEIGPLPAEVQWEDVQGGDGDE